MAGDQVREESTRPAWSSYHVIDIHAHCGSFRGFDLNSHTLMDNIQRYGISLALVSNIDGAHLPGTTRDLDQVSANRETEKLVRGRWERLRGLVWTRPNDGAADELKQFLQLRHNGKRVFVGMKFHPDMNQFPADERKVDPFLELCRKEGVPAVFHCGRDGTNSSADRIYALARRFPSVPVVLYHAGFGSDHRSALQAVQKSLKEKDASLYLETSQCSAEDALAMIALVGADRVLFGTDATYYGKRHYDRYKAMMDSLKTRLPASSFHKVIRGNAINLFNL